MAELAAGRIPTPEDFEALLALPIVQPYPPVLGGGWSVGGDGSIVGNYLLLEDWCWAWGRIIFGASAGFAGTAPSITLPFPMLSQSYARNATIRLRDADGSPTEFAGAAEPNSFQTFSPLYLDTSGAAGVYGLVSDTGPFTWDEADEILWDFRYQVDTS